MEASVCRYIEIALLAAIRPQSQSEISASLHLSKNNENILHSNDASIRCTFSATFCATRQSPQSYSNITR